MNLRFFLSIHWLGVLLVVCGCSSDNNTDDTGDTTPDTADSETESDTERSTETAEPTSDDSTDTDTTITEITVRRIAEENETEEDVTADSIVWFAVMDNDETRAIPWTPDSELAMRVSVQGDRYGIAYQCANNAGLTAIYTTVQELTQIDMICPVSRAMAGCDADVEIVWDGFEGNGALITTWGHEYIEHPETSGYLAPNSDRSEFFVADTQDGIPMHLYSRPSNDFSCSDTVVIDLAADANLYTSHPLSYGALSHNTELIPDETRHVYCTSTMPDGAYAYTCKVPSNSTQFSAASGAAINQIAISGWWDDGHRRSYIQLENPPPAAVELFLLTPIEFTEIQHAGRTPSTGIIISQDPYALAYIYTLRYEDDAEIHIIATRSWVDDQLPLLTPDLTGTSVSLSTLGQLEASQLVATWSNLGTMRAINKVAGHFPTESNGESAAEITAIEFY
ncbi:MAG: hypothetical protein JXX29_04795 [Deltaproteobacteria bacterium]|nr:hypothetical protein [Deltaproteobacteria bacterium]MBN2670964.1 hypothetical protein [Deltaproteobacteria bacterium]